ncbi:hypothetical protein D3C73_1609120 [compost metagenome]
MDDIPRADDNIRHGRRGIRAQIYGFVEKMVQVVGGHQEAGDGGDDEQKSGYFAGKPFVYSGITADQNKQENW